MTSYATIENKQSSIRKYLSICKNYQKYTLEEIEKDTNIRGMVERYLYLAAQATIDLAEAYVSYKNFRKPTTMSESFYILQEGGIIDQDLCARMISMTGFRNVIAHDYDKVNYSIVYKSLRDGLNDIEEFLSKAI